MFNFRSQSATVRDRWGVSSKYQNFQAQKSTQKMGYIAGAAETQWHLKFEYNLSFGFTVKHKIFKDGQNKSIYVN